MARRVSREIPARAATVPAESRWSLRHDAAFSPKARSPLPRAGGWARTLRLCCSSLTSIMTNIPGVMIIRYEKRFTSTMTIRAELDLASYGRLFPAQDFMPKGSFGNLIALPLNGECRKRGTTVFLDPSTLEPFEDQWAFLSTLARPSPKAVADIARSIPAIGAGPDDANYRRPSTADSPKPPEGQCRRDDQHRAHRDPTRASDVAQTCRFTTQSRVRREGTCMARGGCRTGANGVVRQAAICVPNGREWHDMAIRHVETTRKKALD